MNVYSNTTTKRYRGSASRSSTRAFRSRKDSKARSAESLGITEVALVGYIITVFLASTPFAAYNLQVVFASIAVIGCLIRMGRNSVPITLPGCGGLPLFFFYAFMRYATYDLEDFSDGIYFARAALGMLLMMLLPFAGNRWAKLSIYTIVICGFVHAVATIAFSIVPSLYSAFYNPIFLNGLRVTSVTGAKAGLTTHYSSNGIFLSLGIVTSSGPLLTAWNNRSEHRALWTTVFILFLWAILITTKRSSLLFSAVVILAAYFFAHSEHPLEIVGKLVLALPVVVILAMFIFSINQNLFEVFDRFVSMLTDDSLAGRAPMYRACLQMWYSAPLFGAGWGPLQIYPYFQVETHTMYFFNCLQRPVL